MAKKKSQARSDGDAVAGGGAEKGSDSPDHYTPDRVRKFANHLRLLAGEFDALAKAMEDEALVGTNMRDKMLRRSVLHITNFGDQLRRAIRESRDMDF